MSQLFSILMVGCLLLAAGSGWAAPDNTFNVHDFGAIGDGAADDTHAIQSALDAAEKAGNGVALLPAGSYLITDSLKVGNGVTLEGEGVRWENAASTVVVKKNGFAAIRLVGPRASVKGLHLSYPDNSDMVNPTPYPPAIQLESINPSVENVHFSLAWDGICTPEKGANAGQSVIKNITGFVHNVGIRLDGPADVVRIEDVHWFVAGTTPEGKTPYFRRNRVGFQFGRVDGLLMSKCFIIGGKTFFQALPTTPDGKPAHSLGFYITQCWIEAVKNGFVIEGTCGFVLSDTNILIEDSNGAGIRLTMPNLFYNSAISNTQVRYAAKGNGPAVIYAPTSPHWRNRLGIANCQFDVPPGYPAIRIGAQAQRFTMEGTHVIGNPAILVEKGADLISIQGNILKGAIEDHTAKDAKKLVQGNLDEDSK